MSDSEDFMYFSQESKLDYCHMQSSDYGGYIVDNECQIVGNVVSLENEIRGNEGEGGSNGAKTCVLYDQVEIEDISFDEDLLKM